jgi:hypothetical protein
MRLDVGPKCLNVDIEWPVFGYGGYVRPHIMLEGLRSGTSSIASSVSMRRGYTQGSGDFAKVGDLPEDAKSSTEMEPVGLHVWLGALDGHENVLFTVCGRS